MKRWLRRIRGAIGVGLAWGFAWFSAGMILLLIVGVDAADVPFPIGFGALGFLAGVTFSAVLGIVERHRRFDQMSLPRFSAWGAVGGLLFSVVFVLAAGLGADLLLILGPVFALSGAGCAGGLLALARRAKEPELLDAGADVAGVRLAGGEAEELMAGRAAGPDEAT